MAERMEGRIGKANSNTITASPPALPRREGAGRPKTNQ